MNILQSRTSWIQVLLLVLMLGIPVTIHAGSREPMPVSGNFSLVDERGSKVTLESYRGHYLLIYFGYTYCPDVCPTSLGIVAQVLEGLSQEVLERLQPLFITVDPERDTQTHMTEYTEAFHPKLMGLTGSVEETNRAARTFGVYFAKAEIAADDPTDYLVDHSSNTFLLDPQGRIIEIYGHAPEVASVIRGIQGHIKP